MDQQVMETVSNYDNIINEVITKLKRNSDKGQLQMSESEIQTFKDLWQTHLKAIQEGREIKCKTEVQVQSKNSHVETDQIEPAIEKKVLVVKQEEENQEVDVCFDDDSDEKVHHNQDHVDNYQSQNQKIKEFEKNRCESLRERTLFDKIRELDQLRNQVKQEEQDDDDTEEPKAFDTQIYAQKINTDSIVSRIRPNKLQKASLENVLIKEKSNKEALYPQAQLQFNFKTNKKKNQ
ncbi:unnamed protein product (macronuclear) [Paramecium tetraurelia]|uniref:TFIIS central domain-containing protein n=1 Tax=Paramecium tetraurelia TaxID=5888 RepID=A0D5U3_PARTE|nr:uncharacterized protein GSPATT00013840001 [Paramecium tetraurelia]CAK78410.1 unnamed protein product [Paramecium tetraurelia]|eukprot:XP_001445807.1 hypothetical protein (macronuclear) [Paramecium tetraurelia strain d4-2]